MLTERELAPGGLRQWNAVQIYRMIYQVQMLRREGRLLSRDELARLPPAEGRLLTHSAPSRFSRAVLVATLVDPRSQTAENRLLPPLYCVELLGIATLAIRLRGFELIGRGEQARVVLQEWLCSYRTDPSAGTARTQRSSSG